MHKQKRVGRGHAELPNSEPNTLAKGRKMPLNDKPRGKKEQIEACLINRDYPTAAELVTLPEDIELLGSILVKSTDANMQMTACYTLIELVKKGMTRAALRELENGLKKGNAFVKQRILDCFATVADAAHLSPGLIEQLGKEAYEGRYRTSALAAMGDVAYHANKETSGIITRNIYRFLHSDLFGQECTDYSKKYEVWVKQCANIMRILKENEDKMEAAAHGA